MSKVMKEAGHRVYSSDIRSTGYGEQMDFLKSRFPCDAIITNPPFKQSVEFIEHALSMNADVVAMLLKSQYWHAKSRVNLFNKHTPAYVLPITWRVDFLERFRKQYPEQYPQRSASTMDCLWTVWLKDFSGSTSYKPLSKGGAA